jgi:amidase
VFSCRCTAGFDAGDSREPEPVTRRPNRIQRSHRCRTPVDDGRPPAHFRGIARYYITRILALDQAGPGVNAIIQLNPDALAIARQADALRRRGIVLGPLHGIPVLLKDNIDTGDRMQTTAGSFALFGRPALQDSTVARNLRAGGAVILGKTNLSEWANFRSFESIGGWSGRGGQTNNPYGIDRNPCGSSSGSGASRLITPSS